MSNEEQGIAQAQTEAARAKLAGGDGLRENQQGNIAYVGERILTYALAMAVLGLCVLWATTPSMLMFYGSLGLVILLTILWGVVRIRRTERVNAARAELARSMKAERAARPE